VKLANTMLRFEEIERPGAAVALISDASDGDCAFKGSAPALASQHRERICELCAIDPRHLVCAQQAHECAIAWAQERDRGRHWGGFLEPFPETDAILTDVRGLPLAIFVADCVPVFLYDEHNHIGGLVHAGREGTLSRITEKAVAAMRERRNSNPADVHALIGPSAGPCCYQVSEEMAASFADAGFPLEGRHLDLWKANALQLRASGVLQSHITLDETCTICTTTYFSHRRQPNGARNMALMML
jgi:YfiH family protein